MCIYNSCMYYIVYSAHLKSDSMSICYLIVQLSQSQQRDIDIHTVHTVSFNGTYIFMVTTELGTLYCNVTYTAYWTCSHLNTLWLKQAYNTESSMYTCIAKVVVINYTILYTYVRTTSRSSRSTSSRLLMTTSRSGISK